MKISQTAGFTVSILMLLTAQMATAGTPVSPFKALQPVGPASDNQANNYLGAGMGKVSTGSFCEALENCDEGDKSWKVFAGVRLNENIVLEGSYVDFGEQSGLAGTDEISQKVTAFTTTAVAGFPLNEQIDIFGKAGMARWSAETAGIAGNTDSNGTDVMVGMGTNYKLSESMGVRAEWERYKDIAITDGQESDIDLLSLGITFSSL